MKNSLRREGNTVFVKGTEIIIRDLTRQLRKEQRRKGLNTLVVEFTGGSSPFAVYAGAEHLRKKVPGLNVLYHGVTLDTIAALPEIIAEDVLDRRYTPPREEPQSYRGVA